MDSCKLGWISPNRASINILPKILNKMLKKITLLYLGTKVLFVQKLDNSTYITHVPIQSTIHQNFFKLHDYNVVKKVKKVLFIKHYKVYRTLANLKGIMTHSNKPKCI